jgi:hypothetical protein
MSARVTLNLRDFFFSPGPARAGAGAIAVKSFAAFHNRTLTHARARHAGNG